MRKLIFLKLFLALKKIVKVLINVFKLIFTCSVIFQCTIHCNIYEYKPATHFTVTLTSSWFYSGLILPKGKILILLHLIAQIRRSSTYLVFKKFDRDSYEFIEIPFLCFYYYLFFLSKLPLNFIGMPTLVNGSSESMKDWVQLPTRTALCMKLSVVNNRRYLFLSVVNKRWNNYWQSDIFKIW